MDVPLSDIVIRKRMRKELGDLESLCSSISDVGLLHPVVLTPDKRLVSGRRRVAAFKKLGREKIPARIIKGLDDALTLLKAERDENSCRLDFSITEAVALGQALEKLERPKAKERKSATQGRPPKTGGKLPPVSAGDPGKTRDKVGSAIGMSGRQYEKAKAVVASGNAELISEMDTSGKVDTAYRKLKESARNERRIENAKKVSEVPESLEDIEATFATIVADPPWDWGDEGDCDQLGRARPQYATMSIEQLVSLPVGNVADADCHLYLWITNRSLPKGFALLDAWGFRYVTCLTWCKPSFGMGNYFRGQTEQVLFGVRGSQSLKRKDVGTFFQAPRGPRGHSSKPVEFYDLVESCSPGPYLELFARGNRDGWHAWGAESSD